MPLRNRPRLALSAADAATLEHIWNEHAASVLGMLKTYCASLEDAQDTLQELFLRVGKNPSVVQSAKSPRAFLIVSARRIAIDAARKRASDLRREESPEAAEAVHPSPVAMKNDADLSSAISRAVADLPSEQRIVFEGKILHGKTLTVIAAEQSITLNTAASRLRYSLDKIRTRLRPHYEAMKNQTTKSNTLSDSTARLIKPLEPKRVPSVVPGLEGVAAFAVHEPILCVCPAPVEIPVPEPVDHAVHVDPLIPEPELPTESVDHATDDHGDPIVTQEVEPTDAEVHGDQTGDASSSVSEEDLSHNPGDSSDGSTDLLTAIFESNFSNEESSADHGPESGIDFTDDSDQHNPDQPSENPDLADFLTLETQPGQTDGESVEDNCQFDEHDYNDYLLREYKNFLGDNPDWIEEHQGGDIQAQVITSSEYTGIEWENPGAARSFDQWFHDTYIAPYEGSTPVEGGMPLGAPDGLYHDRVVSGETDGTPNHSGYCQNYTGIVHTENLNTGHDPSVPVLGETSPTIVTGGRVVAADPIEGSITVENGGSVSIGHSLELSGGGLINGALMRGGALELSGGQLIVNSTVAMADQVGGSIPTLVLSGGSPLPINGPGIVHTENLNTGHDPSVPVLGETSPTIVTGGRVIAADPIEGSITVENGGSVSIGDRVFGEGTYNFNAETAMDSESQSVSAVTSPVDAASATVKPEHTAEAHENGPMGFSVTPIVSGSDSPISTEEVHGMHAGHDATTLANLHTPSPASVELPVLIHSQEIQHLDAVSDHETGITFVDDDTYVAPASPDMNAVPVGVPASATHDVAAAMGGAFVAGSATQVAPAAKGLSPRKSLIA